MAAVVIMALVIRWLPQGSALSGGAVARIALVTGVGVAVYAATILLLFPVVTRDVWRRLATR